MISGDRVSLIDSMTMDEKRLQEKSSLKKQGEKTDKKEIKMKKRIFTSFLKKCSHCIECTAPKNQSLWMSGN